MLRKANEINQSIAKELVNTEKKRLMIFIGVVVFGLTLLIINFSIFPIIGNYLQNPRSMNGGIALNFCFLILLILSRIIIEKISRKRGSLPFLYHAYEILLETVFPMLWLIHVIYYEKSAVFLDSPLLFIYLPLIIVSSLQLSFRQGLLTGTVVGVFYAAVSHWAFVTYPDTISFPLVVYYSKAILFVMAGVCAGLVSREIMDRLKTALQTQAESSKIEKLFSQQVSKEVAEALKTQGDVSVKGIATIFFLDIRNFTQRIQYLPPQEINDFQNRFFGPMVECINTNGGVINQIMGDGLMASFAEGDHIAAYHSATEILDRIREMNKETDPPVEIGIGIHTGEIVAGNIGSEERRQFSISGSAVVMAARLEQLTKEHECSCFISIDFYNLIKHLGIKGKSIGQTKIKGFDETIEVIQLL
ncbi:MAG: adenylate/guanylate cyclase domain-containing protein [Bacteroidota bacterium]